MMTKMTTDEDFHIAGIDYSLTSPAICISLIENGKFSFENSRLYFMRQNKGQNPHGENVYATDYPEYTSDIQRYSYLAEWCLARVRWFNGRAFKVYIEDYAFSATGRVFHIAENVAILKKTLVDAGIQYETIPPTVVKKHATGKGNASKEMMYESFLAETQLDLRTMLSPKSTKIGNPVSDLVDAYYICKTGYEIEYEKSA